MKQLLVIGIGAGNPDYITMQAVKALNRVDVFFLMDKGQSKDKLIDLRREICERYISDPDYRFVEAHSPERERGDVDYTASVDDLNRAKQQTFERLINDQLSDGQCGGFLVWGGGREPPGAGRLCWKYRPTDNLSYFNYQKKNTTGRSQTRHTQVKNRRRRRAHRDLEDSTLI